MREPSGRRGLFLRLSLLVAATVGAYWPALRGGFIWDDESIYILSNKLLRDPSGLLKFWFSTEPGDYYPLTYTVLWFEWRLFETNVVGYHLVNVALHVGVALLVWRIAHQGAVPTPWLISLLFALHPVAVESVAWISQLKTLLGTIFGLAAASLLLQRRPVAAWICFALGLAGKPVLIALPILVFVVVWWRAGLRRALIAALPGLALSLVFGVVGVWFQSVRTIGSDFVRPETLAQRSAIAGHAVWFYIGKAVVPRELLFVYPRWNLDYARAATFLPTACVIGLTAMVWMFRERLSESIVVAWTWVLLALLPALGFVDVYYWRYSFVADHYLYSALPAVLAIIVIAVFRVSGRRDSVLWALGLPTAALFAVLTFDQAKMYRDEETVWRGTLAKNPEAWLAHGNLGTILANRGDRPGAYFHFQRAFEIEPGAAKTLYNLGKWLGENAREESRIRQAIDLLERSLRQKPDFSAAALQQGLAWERLQQWSEAETAYRRALTIQSDYAEARVNLGVLLARRGDWAGAADCFREVLRLHPQYFQARNNLAVAERELRAKAGS